MNEKFCISYSTGKDSALALYKMIQAGYEPVALIVSVDNSLSRSWFHGVSSNILEKVSESLDIPLIEARSDGSNYEDAFVDALLDAKKLGATICAFGDIDIKEHKIWNTQITNKAGLKTMLPLWQSNRKEITKEFITTGFKSYIKTVSKSFGMSKAFLGKTLTLELIAEIDRLGFDPCGENGEYHTFCYDGPLFKYPIKTHFIDIHESNYSYSLNAVLSDI